MDLLKIAISAYAVLLLLNVAAAPFLVGQPRKPVTAATAGCTSTISIIMFVVLLLTWQRL